MIVHVLESVQRNKFLWLLCLAVFGAWHRFAQPISNCTEALFWINIKHRGYSTLSDAFEEFLGKLDAFLCARENVEEAEQIALNGPLAARKRLGGVTVQAAALRLVPRTSRGRPRHHV